MGGRRVKSHSSMGMCCSHKDSNMIDNLYFDIKENQMPIIYSPLYNIQFLGLERLHPFDAGKWGKICHFLEEANIISKNSVVEPREAKEADLLVVHSPRYLASLKWSYNVAAITEIPFVALLPNILVQRSVLKPFRMQTGGSVLAGKLAMERGWAINIGGGFHHCSSDHGGGFCAYADITLCIKFLFKSSFPVCLAMIVDLDAHQGNGHERDFMNDDRVYILDVYNRQIYPHDEYAKGAIARNVGLKHYIEDTEYIEKVQYHLNDALSEFEPHILIYNAGTDILQHDPLGNLSISPQGIIARDELVFHAARTRNIPIVMLTSGGYQRSTARIIADSIINLYNKGYLQNRPM